MKYGKAAIAVGYRSYHELALKIYFRGKCWLLDLEQWSKAVRFCILRPVRTKRHCNCHWCRPVWETMILRVLCPSEP